MSDPNVLTQYDLDYMYEGLGSATDKDQLQLKLKDYNPDELNNLYSYIGKQPGLADKLVKNEWITPVQKKEIDFVAANTLRFGGKRRYSTRSKKYKKSNKRSKRTRTLRRKRYSRKS
jgi:hypothetical protein